MKLPIQSKFFFRCFIIDISKKLLRRLHGNSTKLNPEESVWRSVVGLEVHAQVQSKSKLFSSAPVEYGLPTNTGVSYFDAAFPGTLPVLNKYCVEAAILTALALNCTVNSVSKFDRKHYFYPDLPAGFQITQQFHPIASGGHVQFIVQDSGHSYQHTANLKQIQLEQDSGKSFHAKEGLSYVDLNRAGTALMELVFEPDLKNGSEASALVKELILILRRIGTCSCIMEEGMLRVDANISVHRENEPLGVRTEVKNINSLRYIARAVDHEIERQKKILENGNIVVNETRGFDYKKNITVFLRDKENLQDYRFMPEPNLPVIVISESKGEETEDGAHNTIYLDEVRKKLPVLPEVERQKLINVYKLPLELVEKLLDSDRAIEIFLTIAQRIDDYPYICEFLFNSVQHQLNVRKSSFKECVLTTDQMGDIIELIVLKTISPATGNDILQMLYDGDERTALEIVKAYNWFQISNEEELETLCLQVIKECPKVAQRYRKSGKRRYMTVLLIILNEHINNRASIRDAENVFDRLIRHPKGKEELSSKPKS